MMGEIIIGVCFFLTIWNHEGLHQVEIQNYLCAGYEQKVVEHQVIWVKVKHE